MPIERSTVFIKFIEKDCINNPRYVRYKAILIKVLFSSYRYKQSDKFYIKKLELYDEYLADTEYLGGRQLVI